MLFPAHAGVILESIEPDKVWEAFPRPCGGDPDIELELIRREYFSPPMRG